MLMCKAAMIAMGGWGIASVVAVSTNCAVARLGHRQDDQTCNGTARWLSVTILDGSTEIAIMVMVICLVSRLQMTVKKKFEVCSAFAWRFG
jgi:hypothetical protein